MFVDDRPRRLLSWYDDNARLLPWRHRPGMPRPDPYRVWLSEIMLQQTTVAAVIPYFEHFVQTWPTVEALATAEDADVMTAWAGLGYYARARNLLACARTVVRDHGGLFPDTEEGLRALPGIGAYTAAAIAAIAFDRPATVVDGNVERVMSRIFRVDTPLPQARPLLRAHAATLTPDLRSGDYAQAVMDLGATICTPKAPACPRCPWRHGCAAHAAGDPASFPIKVPKTARPIRHGLAFWLESDGHVLLVRRGANGLLGGMLALPTSDWIEHFDEAASLTSAPASADWHRLPTPVRHVFTHFELVLHVARARVDLRPPIDGTWVPIDRIDSAGLPTVFLRAAHAALEPTLL